MFTYDHAQSEISQSNQCFLPPIRTTPTHSLPSWPHRDGVAAASNTGGGRRLSTGNLKAEVRVEILNPWGCAAVAVGCAGARMARRSRV